MGVSLIRFGEHRDMWKKIFQSVQGTSHLRLGLPCQDSCLATELVLANESILILVCADGAGSATHADLGARTACETAVRAISSDLESTTFFRLRSREHAVAWIEKVREELSNVAASNAVEFRQLACTLLIAIIGEHTSVFLQIGDGAIVVREDDGYRYVFWPQSGVYANTTNFVTDVTFDQALSFESRSTGIDELAIFTDGLQMLALDFTTRSAHAPFFSPMFLMIRDCEVPDELFAPLRAFLDSPRITERTDDDKTLMLATRVSHNGNAI